MSESTMSLLATNNPISMTHKALVSNNDQPLMSSNEIAELTGKSKSDVHVDIWNMLKQLYAIEKDDGKNHHHKNQQVTVTDGVIACFDNRGYVSEFLLDRRHTEILITGYDVKRRAAVIDRWFALESGAAKPQHAVPQTLSEALMLAANLAKENEKLAEERDEAIRTKAQISQTREATACQRNAVYQRLANNAIKEREEMAALLGASKEWASTRAVWRATGMWYGYRRLMNWCDDHNMPDTYCFDPKSDDRMLCYPRQAWVEVYGVDIAKLF
ncbi:TPA: Rha family transcriptional regulator [Salmonella enterica]